MTFATPSGRKELKVIDAVADFGAQTTIFPASLRAANNAKIDVKGVVDATISALSPSGERFKRTSRVYIVRNIDEVYLSLDVLVGLRIVNEFFPVAGAGNQHGCAHCAAAAASSPSCKCLPRKPPPGMPEHLPMAPSQSNIAEMKAWLLERYGASSFNKCTHQPLPRMDGPPVEIHLVEDAVPRRISTPATIPLHWQDQVKADLDSNMAQGVIEKVEEPSAWCQRMVCVQHPNGRPRRTVDLQPLNNFCKWITNAPAKQARSVPKQCWKTVTDAWNGYHSVPLRPEDRHLTTFITLPIPKETTWLCGHR